MRAKFLICLMGAALGFAAAEAKAEDVYVDLSVLNELAPNRGPIMHSEPLFPIVKKSAPQKATVKKKAPKKETVKKAEKPAKRKLKIKQKEIVKAPVVEEKVEEKITLPSKPDDIFATEEVVIEKPASAAPVVNVKAEEIKEAEAPREFVAEVKNNGMQSVRSDNNATVVQNQETSSVATSSEAEKPIVKEEVAPIQTNVATEEGSASAEKTVVQPEVKEIKPLLPINNAPVVEENIVKQISFAQDSFELTESNKEKITNIVNSFDDPKTNKIAILAYNFDNGEDVFKKKRQSLNRAIEVRPYLLGKGYKNFSIKVINITDDAAKGNIVEIDEIK